MKMVNRKVIYIIGLILIIVLGAVVIGFANNKDCEKQTPITSDEKCINTTDRVCTIDTRC